MRRRRVNSRQKRWWTSNRGAAKVGRESRPERSNSVYTGRLRARRLGARARGFASSRYVSTSKYLTTAVHRYMVGGRRWAMGTCRPPSLPHVRTASMQHAHARVDAPAHTHIFFAFDFLRNQIFFRRRHRNERERGRDRVESVVVHCLSGMSQKMGSDPIPRDDFVRH